MKHTLKKKLAMLLGVLLALPVFAQEQAPLANPHTIMRPTLDWYKKHIAKKVGLPKMEAPVNHNPPTATAGVNLYNNLSLQSCGGIDGWNQGYCGSCWVWGSSAAASMMNGLQTTIPQLFSVQWFNSSYYASGTGVACEGGDVVTWASWYNNNKKFIPWTNTNAGYTDQQGGTPHTPANTISTTPNIPFTAISVSEVVTATTTQDQAIKNIKYALDMGKPVVFAYYLPGAGWNSFNNFWDSSAEQTAWADIDRYNGQAFDNQGGGHLVCIVGYDSNSWIVLNSWGSTSGRPNGCFRIPQAMGYKNYLTYSGTKLTQYEFDVLNITWTNVNPPDGSVTARIISPFNGAMVQSGESIQFDGEGSSSNSNAVLTYTWNFGDGSTGKGANVNNTYVNAGSTPIDYDVTLTVSDNTGASNKVNVNISVQPSNTPPSDDKVTASISSMSIPAGTRIDFVGAGSSSNNLQLRYSWNFGDGSLGQGANVSHIFDNAGSSDKVCQVVLNVLDSNNNMASENRTIVVTPGSVTPPDPTTLQISPASAVVKVGSRIRFKAITNTGGQQVTWSCTGGTINANGMFTAPMRPGTYQVYAQVGNLSAVAQVRVRR